MTFTLAAKDGVTPLGEIIAAHLQRDYDDAVPEPVSRHQVWQQQHSDALFEVALFLGNHALVRSARDGSAWHWRIRAGLIHRPEFSYLPPPGLRTPRRCP